MPLILASSSVYRQQLLKQLQIPFQTCSPDIDETPKTGESPKDIVFRLAKEKANAVAPDFSSHLIIASDQVAVIEDEIIGKPLVHEAAVKQLTKASGKTVSFYTSICLLNARSGNSQLNFEVTKVKFRELSLQQINSYLKRDKPYDCAGSFRAESLGITLFESIQSNDPNALIGLPLIKLTSFLNNEGFKLY